MLKFNKCGENLKLYQPILIGQEKGIENWRMNELLSGVNLEYDIVWA